MGTGAERKKAPAGKTVGVRVFPSDLLRIDNFRGPRRTPHADVIHEILDLAGLPPAGAGV